jgi:hypothetical protein
MKWHFSCNCHRIPPIEKLLRRIEMQYLQHHRSINRHAEETLRYPSKNEWTWECFEIHPIGFERWVSMPLACDRIRNQIEKKSGNFYQQSVIGRRSGPVLLLWHGRYNKCHKKAKESKLFTKRSSMAEGRLSWLCLVDKRPIPLVVQSTSSIILSDSHPLSLPPNMPFHCLQLSYWNPLWIWSAGCDRCEQKFSSVWCGH